MNCCFGTTEATEITESGRRDPQLRILCNCCFSVASVPSVVSKLPLPCNGASSGYRMKNEESQIWHCEVSIPSELCADFVFNPR